MPRQGLKGGFMRRRKMTAYVLGHGIVQIGHTVYRVNELRSEFTRTRKVKNALAEYPVDRNHWSSAIEAWKRYRKDFLPKVIDYWKVIMTTTNGEEVELEDIPEDVAAEIDEVIASRYDVSWASGREEEVIA